MHGSKNNQKVFDTQIKVTLELRLTRRKFLAGKEEGYDAGK